MSAITTFLNSPSRINHTPSCTIAELGGGRSEAICGSSSFGRRIGPATSFGKNATNNP